MIVHRCDMCGKDLSDEERNKPFIRISRDFRLAASIMVVNDRGKSVEDLCEECKLSIILNGEPSNTLTIPHDVEHLKPLPTPVIAEAAPPQIKTEEPTVYERSEKPVATLQDEKGFPDRLPS